MTQLSHNYYIKDNINENINDNIIKSWSVLYQTGVKGYSTKCDLQNEIGKFWTIVCNERKLAFTHTFCEQICNKIFKSWHILTSDSLLKV